MAENNKDKLPHLASEIKSGLDLAEKGKQDRINGLVQAAIALHEARSLIKADIRFNKWCTANEFGPDVLNAHDRAALIAMGADPERMRSLLSNSERQSVRYIYLREWSAAESAGAADDAGADGDVGAGAADDAGADGDSRCRCLMAMPVPLTMPILPKVGLPTQTNQKKPNKSNSLEARAIRVAANV